MDANQPLPNRELTGAEKALFEALMSQGCSPVTAAEIAAEQAAERRAPKQADAIAA